MIHASVKWESYILSLSVTDSAICIMVTDAGMKIKNKNKQNERGDPEPPKQHKDQIEMGDKGKSNAQNV